MICPECESKQEHDGVYCTICGRCFVDLDVPAVVYFRGGQIEIKLKISHNFTDALTLEEVRIGGQNRISRREYIHPGTRILKLKADETNRVFRDVEVYQVVAQVRRSSLASSRKLPIYAKELRYSQLPEVTLLDADGKAASELMLDLSPCSGYYQKLGVKVNNHAAFKLSGLKLRTRVNQRDPSKRAELIIPAEVVSPREDNNGVALATHSEELPGWPETSDQDYQVVMLDFSGLSKGATATLIDESTSFNLELLNEYGCNEEINARAKNGLPSIRFNMLQLTDFQLAVWKSVENGFTYMVHNEAFTECTKTSNQLSISYPLIGYYTDYLSEDTIQDFPGVYSEELIRDMQDMASNKIRLRIPCYIQRVRTFTLYLNYQNNPQQAFDLENNHFCMFLHLSPNSSHLRRELYDLVQMRKIGSPHAVRLGEELDLGNQFDLKGFQIIFNLASEFREDIIEFAIEIVRYNPHDRKRLSSKNYTLFVEHYYPQINSYPVAIDFGTSNTCVVGPDVEDDEPIGNEATTYCLDYLHISTGIMRKTIPTLLDYYDPGIWEAPYIPDSQLLKEKCFSSFKQDLNSQTNDVNRGDEPDAVKLTVDFFRCLFELIEIYCEDRKSPYVLFKKVNATAPVSFPPELKSLLSDRLCTALNQRYKLDCFQKLDFSMSLDEPFAALVFASEAGLLSPESLSPELGRIIGVMDFGGGTLDTAFLIMEADGPVLVETGGSQNLGGNTIDLWVFKRLLLPASKPETVKAQNLDLSFSNKEIRTPGIKAFKNDKYLADKISLLKESFGLDRESCGKVKIEIPTDNAFYKFILSVMANSAEASAGNGLCDKLDDLLISGDQAKKFSSSRGQNDLAKWGEISNVIEHLLIPFYFCFYNKLKEILRDSLSWMNNWIEKHSSSAKYDMKLFLAGNASLIHYMKELIEDILRESKQKIGFPFSYQVDRVIPPKECVGRGAYINSCQAPIEVRRLNEPPFSVYREFPLLSSPPAQSVTIVNGKRMIKIFECGDKNIHNRAETGYLLKAFKCTTIGIHPGDKLIGLVHKVGIDYRKSYPELIWAEAGNKKVMFVLDKLNRVSIFAYDNLEDLIKQKTFIEQIDHDEDFRAYMNAVDAVVV